MNIIASDKAPAAVGPYSQAIEVNGTIFCAGQIGIDPATGNVVEGIEAQIHQIFANIEGVLSAAGTDISHVVKTTVFLQNMSDYAVFNELYGNHFGDHKPARSTVAVAKLPKDALIEIEVIAVKS